MSEKDILRYTLMHKDDECGILSIDKTTGRFVSYKDYDYGNSPYLGNADLKKIKRWWEMRAIPANRETIQKLINSFNCVTNEEYLAKNLALSVTDAYWIRPIESDHAFLYDEINFYNLQRYNDGKVPYHNATSYSPDASLGGQMEKYWDLSKGKPVLVKQAFKSFGQQAINEKFATLIHERQQKLIPYTSYDIAKMDDGSVYSLCDAFTDRHTEFIPAYEILESTKMPNDMNLYETYIKICAQNGIDEDAIRVFMDYQTLTDFVISNTDEHLMNFGVLRDIDSLEIFSPAPIFDSGNSMFYDDLKTEPFTRAELLSRKITSFYDIEEKILKNVYNKNIVTLDLLPEPNEVAEFYKENGIPERRADVIAQNYSNKLILLHEFQHGKTVSHYFEAKNPITHDYDDWKSKIEHIAGDEIDDIEEER